MVSFKQKSPSKNTHIWGRLKLKANSCKPVCRTVTLSSGQLSSERQNKPVRKSVSAARCTFVLRKRLFSSDVFLPTVKRHRHIAFIGRGTWKSQTFVVPLKPHGLVNHYIFISDSTEHPSHIFSFPLNIFFIFSDFGLINVSMFPTFISKNQNFFFF